MHRARHSIIGAALLVLGVLLLVAPARAHDYLVGSTPENGATLDAAPSTVALEFNTAIGQSFAQVAVVGPDGTDFTNGDPVVDGAVVTQAVEGIPAGTDVTISYRVVSSDGHPIGGTVPFTVAAGAGGDATTETSTTTGTQTPAATGDAAAVTTSDAEATSQDDVGPAAATGSGSGSGLLPWLGLLFVVSATVAGLATFAFTRRRRRSETPADQTADPVGDRVV